VPVKSALRMPVQLSRLGFGLSGIAGSGNSAHQQTLIRTALDSGVTHFDTAPYYGAGDAEKILGDILAKYSDKVTVTTKFGLVPFGGGRLGGLTRAALRPLFKKMKSLKRLASGFVSRVHQPAQVQVQIQKSALVASLDASLRKLHRPVDIFLLHDAALEITRHPAVLEGLAEFCQTGKISLAGISGSAKTVEAAVKENPEIYRVAQLENSLTCPAPFSALSTSGVKIINYRAIQCGLPKLISLLEQRPAFKKFWLHDLGIDPSSSDILVQVLMELALSENPEGTVLFSTTRPERIRSICRALQTPVLGPDGACRVRQLFETI